MNELTLLITYLSIMDLITLFPTHVFGLKKWHHDIQHNNIQHNDTHHNDTQHNGVICNN